MSRIALVLALIAAVSFPCAAARAEVKGADGHGFLIGIQQEVNAPRERVYRALTQEIGQWWDSAHTYSGKSENLYLEPQVKGWFGERLPEGGFVRHLEVVFLAPGKTLRMTGGLGPLQEMGLNGSALTIRLSDQSDGHTRLVLNYAVSGYLPDGLDKLAPIVDRVLVGQMTRLAEHCERKE